MRAAEKTLSACFQPQLGNGRKRICFDCMSGKPAVATETIVFPERPDPSGLE